MTLDTNYLHNLVTSMGGIARSNKYLVELPNEDFTGRRRFETNEPGLIFSTLCRRCTMPGRQILSVERIINTSNQKIAYGYGSNEVSMGFLLTNDMTMKKYFENWQQATVVMDEASSEHYPNYKNEYSRDVNIYQLDNAGNKKYGVKLIDAYPTTVNPTEYSDDNDGYVELSVEISYHRWYEIG
jgi:hypothetical protein